MRSRLALVALLILVAMGASVVSRRPSLSRPQNKPCGSSPCGGQAEPLPHEFDFAYYSVRDGFDSTVLLVSDSPQPIDFALAFHSLSGRPLAAPTMTIQPHAKLTVDLNKLLGEIASDDPDDFAEGSLSVAYDGIGPMPLAGQVSVENPELHLVYESQMVENDPGMMSEIPAVLNSAWWGLGAGREPPLPSQMRPVREQKPMYSWIFMGPATPWGTRLACTCALMRQRCFRSQGYWPI